MSPELCFKFASNNTLGCLLHSVENQNYDPIVNYVPVISFILFKTFVMNCMVSSLDMPFIPQSCGTLLLDMPWLIWCHANIQMTLDLVYNSLSVPLFGKPELEFPARLSLNLISFRL